LPIYHHFPLRHVHFGNNCERGKSQNRELPAPPKLRVEETTKLIDRTDNAHTTAAVQMSRYIFFSTCKNLRPTLMYCGIQSRERERVHVLFNLQESPPHFNILRHPIQGEKESLLQDSHQEGKRVIKMKIYRREREKVFIRFMPMPR